MKTTKNTIQQNIALAEDNIDRAIQLIEEHEETDQDKLIIQENLLKAKEVYEKALKGSTQPTSFIKLKLGWIYMHLARFMAERENVKKQLELAISTTKQALLQKGSLTHKLIIEGYLAVIEGYVSLSDFQMDLFSREQDLDKAFQLAKACNYLCLINDEEELTAKLQRLQSYLHSKRYKDDRDANLNTSVFLAEEALVYFQNNSKNYPITIPELKNKIGNNYASTDGNRRVLIGQALKAYKEGLKWATDKACPLLIKTLNRNISRVQSLLKEQEIKLPREEIVKRFKTRIQQAIHYTDWNQAMNTAWAFLQWSWSFYKSPNIATADAHLIIGSIFTLQDNFQKAIPHYFSSLVVATYFKSMNKDSYLLWQQSKNTFVDFLKKTNHSQDVIHQYLVSSENALKEAFDLCDAAEQVINQDAYVAIMYATQATQWYPFLPYAYFYLGVAYDELPQYQTKSIDSYTMAININPQQKDFWLNRGIVYASIDQYDFAEKDFKEVLKLSPNDINAMRGMINLFGMQKNFEKALEKVNEYIKEYPKEVQLYILRANVFNETGQTEKAIADLTKAIDLASDENFKLSIMETIRKIKNQK